MNAWSTHADKVVVHVCMTGLDHQQQSCTVLTIQQLQPSCALLCTQQVLATMQTTVYNTTAGLRCEGGCSNLHCPSSHDMFKEGWWGREREGVVVWGGGGVLPLRELQLR